jgi:prephenate dehydratase
MILYAPDTKKKQDAMLRVVNTLQIAFQGGEGTHSDEAVEAYFGQQEREGAGRPIRSVPYCSFADVFRAVAVGEVDYGLVPIENSQAGGINDVYELLRQHDIFVIGEINYPVNHCLLGLKGQTLGDIKRVISHPQALAQCDLYLRALGVEMTATYNAADSAKLLYEEQLQGVAVVASVEAAEIYNLEILGRNIQTIKDNYTRFIILGRDPAVRQAGPNKTMLVISIAQQLGSLYTCLGFLVANHINLIKLESRPSQQNMWEDLFYLDFEGHWDDPLFRKTLAALAEQVLFCKVLGSFTRNPHNASFTHGTVRLKHV